MAIASTPHEPHTFAAPPQSEKIPTLVSRLRASFDSGATRGAEWRATQLRQLMRMIEDNEEQILGALKSDLGKSNYEGWIGETNFVKAEIKFTLKSLKRWMKPRRVSTPMVLQPGKARIISEPLGVVLIIAPWNYPFQLALGPLVGAIAAGNAAILKPSEVAGATSRVIAELVPRYLDRDCIAVVEGGVSETTDVLRQRFDHIFYTGNGTVGRIVMEAAAKHLTPVTLELGGKSPCIVDRDVDLGTAVKRICWGKFFNAGQTCVAPDYVLVHESVEKKFLEKMAQTIREFYGDDPQTSGDYGRIVNERHHKRLSALLDGQKTFTGGKTDVADRYIAPTVLTEVSKDSAVMADEIFGPILPVIPVSTLDQAIEFINQRPKPLALYVYSSNAERAERVLSLTSSGGACVNDCLNHLVPHELPFGGVGASGMGAYHGRTSFDTFSHRKSVLDKPTYVDPALRYPPYTEQKQRWAKRLV
jgi:aldehyde dehydrogenase (NAD+)